MKCKVCKKIIKSSKENNYFPFCSERCKMVDLYGWLNEEYSIPEQSSADEEEDEEDFWIN